MKVFVWKNGRPEAQTGYNDDLVMSFGVGMFLRDTSLKFQTYSHDMTRATLGSIQKTSYNGVYGNLNPNNLYQMDNPYGGKEDIKWLL
jgi:hypothetical protein